MVLACSGGGCAVTLIENPAGGYQFLPGIEPFSSGVVALPGYEIVRVTLHSPLPYVQGFALIERYLSARGRPRAALCATELRAPRPYSFAEFAAFNQAYQQVVAGWDILVDDHNPLARTNVAPAVLPPAEPMLYAFAYTVPQQEKLHTPTFVVSGAGELRRWEHTPDAVVRYGETSVEALREKAAQVMHIMSTRLERLHMTWAGAMEASIYTVHPLQPFLVTEILDVIGQASVHGVHWYYSYPPVEGLEFEMNILGVRHERRLDPVS
jgi:hypothetical protein